jgi:hypothetical protein
VSNEIRKEYQLHVRANLPLHVVSKVLCTFLFVPLEAVNLQSSKAGCIYL